jgi:hypothetical protein
MEANVVATTDEMVRVGSKRGEPSNSRKSSDDLSILTQRFRNALKQSVAGIIEAGQVLIVTGISTRHTTTPLVTSILFTKLTTRHWHNGA